MSKKPETSIERFALSLTRWIGSAQSVLVHTVLFTVTILLLVADVFPFNVVILVFNTAVSLEAIYLALFIQMTVNYASESIVEVEHDIDEIQGDIDEIQEDVDEIQVDIDEIQEDVDELQEDVEEMSEEERDDERRKRDQRVTLDEIRAGLQRLMEEVEKLQQRS